MSDIKSIEEASELADKWISKSVYQEYFNHKNKEI